MERGAGEGRREGNGSNARRSYKAPQVLTLQSTEGAIGACSPGSSAVGSCATNGASATGDCASTGGSAALSCLGDGGSAVI